MKNSRSSEEKKRKKLLSSPRLLNEGPDVIGKMTSILENGGSIDTAVRALSEEGPAISRSLFKDIVDDADTRLEPDISKALSRKISDIPECNSAYGMALRMVISAAGTKDPAEKSRILREASEISLTGLREAGKGFCSSLNSPCMVIFGLGIMVPMVLMSILPMMGMSGLFGTSVIGQDKLAVITIVVIPAVVLAVILGISEKNPLKSCRKERCLQALALLSAAPVWFLYSNFIGDVTLSATLALITSCIFTYSVCAMDRKSDAYCRKMERRLQDATFEIGNRLLTGEYFEEALLDTIRSRKECSALADSLRNELGICRGDVEQALVRVFRDISPEMCETLVSVYRASLKNLTDAGRLATSLGRQLKDRESLRKSIRNELKSMTDTMFGTAAVFAPLVLGLSVSMLEPMKALTDSIDTGATTAVLTVYLTELCAMISLLLSFLDGNSSKKDIVRRFAGILPVCMAVFLVALHIGI